MNPDHPDQKVKIRSELSIDLRQQISEFLETEKDAFAWTHGDMKGIPPDVITHKLNVDPMHTLVK